MLSYLKRSYTWLAAVGLLLMTSCQEDIEKLNDAAKFKVALRVKGENLQGLGAEMEYVTTRNASTDPRLEPAVKYEYPQAVDTTYQLGLYSIDDKLNATISWHNVTCGDKPGPNSSFRLEILVNDRIYESKTLGGTAPVPTVCSPFWLIALGSASSDGDGGDWDD